MDTRRKIASRYYKCVGLLTTLFTLAGLVFYIILMVQTFSKETNWLTTTFLIVGLLAMLTILPALANIFVGTSKRISGEYNYDKNE